MQTVIKPQIQSIQAKICEAWNETYDLIHALDFDPVVGNSPHRNSKLDVDLNYLREKLEEARKAANDIAAYQTGTTIKYKK